MKYLNLILSGIIVVTLIACGKNSPKSGMSGGAANRGGTIDGGGGNSYKGKMLESYRVDPRELPAFQEIKPLIATLKNVLNVDVYNWNDHGIKSVFDLIEHVLSKKTWYVIPAKNKSLQNEDIGAPFLENTDQVAIQTVDEVWINQDLFNKKTSTEQAKLILHEVFMGLKIIKQDVRVVCLGGLEDNVPQEQRSKCKQNIENKYQGKVKITAEDTVNVRAVTAKIWNLREQTSEDGSFTNAFSFYDYIKLMKFYKFEAPALGRWELGTGEEYTAEDIYGIFKAEKIQDLEDAIFKINNRDGMNLEGTAIQVEPKLGLGSSETLKVLCSLKLEKSGEDELLARIRISKSVLDKNPVEIVQVYKIPKSLDMHDDYFMQGMSPERAAKVVNLKLKGADSNSEYTQNMRLYYEGEGFVGFAINKEILKSTVVQGVNGNAPMTLGDQLNRISCMAFGYSEE